MNLENLRDITTRDIMPFYVLNKLIDIGKLSPSQIHYKLFQREKYPEGPGTMRGLVEILKRPSSNLNSGSEWSLSARDYPR